MLGETQLDDALQLLQRSRAHTARVLSKEIHKARQLIEKKFVS
jgi:exonuclease VII small subunit